MSKHTNISGTNHAQHLLPSGYLHRPRYGWLDADFRAWVRRSYSWIRLIFVPASCTPVGQPMDAGIIAKAKGVLRRFYGAWVIKLVQGKLDGGAKPEEIRVPSDVPTCKKNLFHWISSTVDELNKDMAGVRQCWASTGLLQAWERSVQVEAAGKLAQLFPNMFPQGTVRRGRPPVQPFPSLHSAR